MSAEILQLIMSLPASLGFALWFNVRKQLLLPATLGGLVSWGVFFLISRVISGPFVPCLIASAVAALYAELLAYRYKIPSSVVFVVAVIPLIPGRLLFYTMSSAVIADWPAFSEYAFQTFLYAAAIAIGISVVWAIFEVIAEAHDRKFWHALNLSRLHRHNSNKQDAQEKTN